MEKITIYRGDTLGFNDEIPYRIKVEANIDLTGFTADIEIARFKKTYNIEDGYIALLMSSEETKQIPMGCWTMYIKIYDTERRIRTVDTSIRMVVKE